MIQTDNFGDVYDEVYPDGCILMAYRGSIANGMYIPDSDPNSIDDIDMMGVYIESPGFYKGLEFKSLGFGGHKKDSQEYWIEQYDVVNYEVRKLFGLLLKGNPNVLSLLFLNPNHIVFRDDVWSDILDNKEVFLSKKAYYSFGGYAQEQLRKMTSGAHEGYMGEKRKRLVEKYGYDTKNAAHLVRLLRMGVEYLKRGHLHVDRTNIDASELLRIKKGEWPLEKVKEEAQRWDDELNKAFERSPLPDLPDFAGANELLVEVIDSYYNKLKGQA